MKLVFLMFFSLFFTACSSTIDKKECLDTCFRGNYKYEESRKFTCGCKEKEDINELLFQKN